MSLIRDDRVAETSTTTGTGAMTLAAAVTGYRRFSAVCAVADTCFYMIEAIDANGVPTGDYETGLGTYSAANTLTRTTVHKSSNANAAVSWAAGTKRVQLAMTAAAIDALSGTAYYAYGTFAAEDIVTSEVIFEHDVPVAHSLGTNLGLLVSVGVNPAASWAADIQKNGSSIGTLTISTAGVITITGTTPVAVAARDVISVIGPAVADTTIARLKLTFLGTI